MDEVLRKVRGICLKDYTRDECLKAAEGAPFGPDQCRRLGEMLYMRAGRGDMSVEDLMQRLFPQQLGAIDVGPIHSGDSVVASAGGQTKTVLCTDCFPAWTGHEVLTVGRPLTPCCACGTMDSRATGGPACYVYPCDPRPADELQALASQTAAVLAPHEQSVVQDALENQGRLNKLAEFLGGTVFPGLGEQDRQLLYRQYSAMTELAFVLAARIQRFNGA